MNTGRFGTQRNYYKPSFVKALDKIIPRVYINTDLDLSSNAITPVDSLINSHIRIANNLSSVIPVNPVAGTFTSAINTLEGISPYFVKQNKLSEIDPIDFERNILLYFNTSFRNFSSSAAFSTFINNTLLSSMYLNSPTIPVDGDIEDNHNYLISELSWLYLLNISGTNGPSIVHDLLLDKTFKGKTIYLNDCLKALSKYLWTNVSSNSSWRTSEYIPSSYLPQQYLTVSNAWTSGTQQLDKLQTMIDVVYSPLYADSKDFRVRDAFVDYIDNSYFLNELQSAGPFWKLLKAYSYSIFDVYNQIDEVRTLNDIDECQEEYLPLLAELIGWPLFGSDPDRWRLQLANAVDVYKKCGTKDSIQFAINSIFSEDVFNISTSIHELWESYIPHLMYYALATDSINFSSTDSWTVSKAQYLNVSGFSLSSHDENIRMAVDTIVYDVVKKYPDCFKLAGRKFPLNTKNFTFNYRGRQFPIPPWEEYPYYVNTEITEEQIDFIADRLVCFGVSNSFAIQILNYIKDNTTRADDDIRFGNSWLFFTSGYNQPPNLDNIIFNSTSKRTEYLPLWSGKSSHYKAILNANSFDFSKDTMDSDSRETVSIAGKVLNEFSPAHSIPSLLLKLSALDDYVTKGVELPLIDLLKIDTPKINYSDTAGFGGYGVSGIGMATWNRDTSAGVVLSRADVNSLTDTMMASTSAVMYPRNNYRRRNLKFLMAKNGYYDRTGFNMPISWDVSSSNNKFLPKGFIPSSLSFQTITSYSSVPAVYSRCVGEDSSAVYYGITASDFYPCRGFRRIESNAKMSELGSRPDYFVDRGQLPDIYSVIHYCMEGKKYWDAYMEVSANYATYASSMYWKDVIQSYANELESPSSVESYYNFEFGRDMHKLYKAYTDYFDSHDTRMDLLQLEGPNIFGHTFGNILRNGSFDRFGTNQTFITRNLGSLQNLGISSAAFNSDSYGRYLASSTSSMYIGRSEIRNATILSGLELVITSGLSNNNYFNVFYLDLSSRRTTQSPYMFGNTFILSKAINGLPRLRYDLRRYPNPSTEGHPITTNFLIPDHEFTLNVRALISNDNGSQLGGGSMGVWIHTADENGVTWSYLPNGTWVKHSSLISKEDLIRLYAHSIDLAYKDRDYGSNASTTGQVFQCLEVGVSSSVKPPVLTSFSENEFDTLSIKFNTKNKPINLPESYYKFYGQVHRSTQNYIFEVFFMPSEQNRDKFMLFDWVNLVNTTLNTWSKYVANGINSLFAIGPRYCPDLRVELSREQIRTVLKYFKSLSNNEAKRDYTDGDTSPFGYNSAGSRLNYRDHPSWINNSLATSGLLLSSMEIYN